jgi:hypothetical protein
LARRPVARAKSRIWRGLTLARIDDGKRQARGGDGGRDERLEAAGCFEHDQAGLPWHEALEQLLKAGSVTRHGEDLARGADMHVELILGDIDADKAGLHFDHVPSLRMRARSAAARPRAALATVRDRKVRAGRGAWLRCGLYGPRFRRAPIQLQPRRQPTSRQRQDTRFPRHADGVPQARRV